jgi:hypothetical protein
VTPDPLLLGALLCAAAGLGGLAAAAALLRRRPLGAARVGAGGFVGLVALLCGVASALFATVAVGLQGYRALTREEVAATVRTSPTGPQRFEVRIELPDGREERFALAGDEFAVDARILKWHPWVNALGLHTAYELDRVSGRYTSLEDEQQRPRTVFALGSDHPVDLFGWRRRLPWLAPLVDAEYGSGTFQRVDGPGSYEVRVSTTGLLVREVP